MVLNPTYLAQRTRSFPPFFPFSGRPGAPSVSSILKANRAIDTLFQSPEIQTMYSLNLPVSAIRTKIRQEFERHRYVNQLPAVDVLLFQSHAEFQETLNFWKQLSHVMKYFRAEEDPTARLPKNFMQGFLEVRTTHFKLPGGPNYLPDFRAGTKLCS
ncbi:NADH-ubiquinone oxidoreductase 14.8 kDa subunit [Uncinocarpus reesii 1704]|uniref:NADH-ubiquinone oxidoreductase 14.8 kDa subunit n=1 Tax=Uncinocarpus reesii (strain UAMH 1704) TaxID=336963 RepID=C4JP00_UNCRE|nr:NADH-ubiquinone oxidoreductase 14.8 kDa subunit [Uncinocarpus reesii 1704]EEP78214.1 NADH-ubiquinone oxidoreductase 14.8 kDa subunit [Uncinocarpus reesii 1704]